MNILMSRRLYMLFEMCPLPSFNEFVCYHMLANAGIDEILDFRNITKILQYVILLVHLITILKIITAFICYPNSIHLFNFSFPPYVGHVGHFGVKPRLMFLLALKELCDV